MNISTRILAAAILLSGLVMPEVASAQWPVRKGPKRLELGYSYVVSRARYEYSTRTFNESTNLFRDSTYNEIVKSSGGLGSHLGYSIPVAKMGPRSRMCINIGYQYNILAFEGDGLQANATTTTGGANVEIFGGTVEMALPIGVDYKFGGEAYLDKSDKFSTAFGAGFVPSYAMTIFRGNLGTDLAIRPYLKAEVGIFAGIMWKVRAMYTFGNIQYIGNDNIFNTNTAEESTTLTGKSQLALQLVVMPFSWMWSKSAWWN